MTNQVIFFVCEQGRPVPVSLCQEVLNIAEGDPLYAPSAKSLSADFEMFAQPKAFARLLLYVAQHVSTDEVLAFSLIRVIGQESEVDYFAVRANSHRLGIGRGLLCWLLDDLRRRQVSCVHLEVASRNQAAIQLYESRGFLVTGERKRYYRDGDTALLMSLKVSAKPGEGDDG